MRIRIHHGAHSSVLFIFNATPNGTLERLQLELFIGAPWKGLVAT